MAQRQGELLKLEMLEKLASLHRELMKEVSMATETHGASASAVETAKELLGKEKLPGVFELQSLRGKLKIASSACAIWFVIILLIAY